ncbi:hypothetical protein Ddye_013432 [Dipteronia dyeriana]|uniref:Pectinesterase inhibitor domain-containing protein n=1 Tax=Dipteronia dyeriana TaxID=168575 RepID=A0AAE0CJM3_9ROSI|nr:hypothetical protein Ddye_013432 [Dipteronia dyeriana]
MASRTAASCVLLLVSVLYISAVLVTAANKPTAAAAASDASFIKTSCTSTTYPEICVRSLSAYASNIKQSPRQLALTALSVSQTRAESCMSFVIKLGKFKNLKPRERKAIKDCLDEVSDTVDRLSKSVQELKQSGQSKGPDFEWHMSNVETWASAALTDENTCSDGFAGKAFDGKVKASVRAQIVSVAQYISNALSLVNQYAEKH